MTTEKRRVARLAPFVAPCRVSSGAHRFAAFVADLSPRGARVTCEHDALLVGDDVLIEVKLARRPTHLSLPGCVAWVRAGDKGSAVFGVTFGHLPEEDRAVLETVVHDFQRLAARLS